MKKALIVTTISGFVPQFCLNDVKILQDMGYEVHYASNFNNPIYRCDKDELKAMGIKLHHISIKKSPAAVATNIKACKKLRKLIEKEEIDLVHAHTPVGGILGRAAAKFASNHPVTMYTAHGFHFYKGAPLIYWILFYTAERLMARCTNIIVTINKEDKYRAKRFKIRKGGSVEKIHGVGVNLDKFKPNPDISSWMRKSLDIPEDAFHIVTAAELNENKNQIKVIEAIALIPNENIYYSLCGKGPNKEKLEARIKQLGLENRVRLLGYRCDMHEVLQTADCFAFPSIREGLGIAAVEALASGVPVIASENRGTREYVRDQFNGILCNPDSVEDFKNAILDLINDEEKRKRMSAHCSESAQAFSTIENDRMMRKIYEKADKCVKERE